MNDWLEDNLLLDWRKLRRENESLRAEVERLNKALRESNDAYDLMVKRYWDEKRREAGNET